MSVIFMYWVNASILARISRALEEAMFILHCIIIQWARTERNATW